MKSIKTKIIVTFVITASALVLALGLFTTFSSYFGALELAQSNMNSYAKLAAERISYEVKSYSNIAADLGGNPEFSDHASDPDTKKALLDSFVNYYGLERGNIIGVDGKSIFDGKDYTDRVYFQKAMEGQPYVSDPVVSKITGQMTIIIAAPLWENGTIGGTPAGCVYIVPKETFLIDIVNSINYGDNSDSYIISKDGVTIANHSLEETAQEINIEKLAETEPKYADRAAIHAKMRSGEEGFERYNEGELRYIAYIPIDCASGGWTYALTAGHFDLIGTSTTIFIISMIFVLISIIVVIIVAVRIGAGIGNPIKLCSDRLDSLAEGDLTSPVPESKRNDEIGVLTAATGSIVKNMNAVISDMHRILSAMAQGDFGVETGANAAVYKGDFEELLTSASQIRNDLSTALGRINTGAEQVAAGSGQVSAGAQSLSIGATTQATSVDELAEAINRISEQIKVTAEHAAAAKQENENTNAELAVCNNQMERMVAAMDTITDKANEIGKIIKAIEDIAFQTNILALNAAVEAARAGEAGKGFAVVADEVRNLAGKSAEAASSTTKLIEETVRAVEEGSRLSDETEKSLLKVVENSARALDSVSRISGATAQQAEAINDVSEGIDRISGVVQTNSATAEESAAASEELSSQADTLKSLVGGFKF